MLKFTKENIMEKMCKNNVRNHAKTNPFNNPIVSIR